MSTSSDVISHWHHSVEGLSTSALDFYASIEQALAAKKVPVSTSRIEYNEGGILSARREYLRLAYGRLIFDISAFPFGTDFYFSWWLTKKKPNFAALFGCAGMLALPVIWGMSVAAAGVFKGTLLALIIVAVSIQFLGHLVREGSSDVADIIVAIPYVGAVFERFFSPTTYYAVDTQTMFQETVGRVVQDVLSGVLVIHGMPPLTAEEKALRKQD